MAEKKWRNVSLMGHGDLAIVAETHATNMVTDIINKLGLKGDEWKIMSSRHYDTDSNVRRSFCIHFAVFADPDINLLRSDNDLDKEPA